MENLQNTITKTDTLKNDLKLAKQKINDKIISGGGTIADTISDVPSAIDKMLGNYKKVASGTCSVSLKEADGFKVTIPLNLDFIPSRLFFVVDFKSGNYSNNSNKGWFELTNLNNTPGVYNAFTINMRASSGDWIRGGFKNTRIITKENAILDLYITIYNSSGYVSVKITEWIAIE